MYLCTRNEPKGIIFPLHTQDVKIDSLPEMSGDRNEVNSNFSRNLLKPLEQTYLQ